MWFMLLESSSIVGLAVVGARVGIAELWRVQAKFNLVIGDKVQIW
jgi:hypothetical protein